MFNSSHHQVLIVDNKPGSLESISQFLTQGGYQVRTAEGGFAALLALKGELPDLILSDLHMPQMSGFELLSIVRRRFPEILAVAMSGAYPGHALPAGAVADRFYPKGAGPFYLLAIITELIHTADTWATVRTKSSAPAWIPRNGSGGMDVSSVSATCEECLRTLHLQLLEETTGQMLEVSCGFCSAKNLFFIEPPILVAGRSQVAANVESAYNAAIDQVRTVATRTGQLSSGENHAQKIEHQHNNKEIDGLRKTRPREAGVLS